MTNRPDARAIPAPPRIPPAWVLGIALLGISVAGPLVRLSAAPAITIAIGRLGFSLLFTVAIAIGTGEWRQWGTIAGRDWLVAAAAGVVLALHFWGWNASIQLTSIAASTTLVTSLQPGVVALLSAVIVHEAPSRRQLVGLGIATLGAVVITAPDLLGHGAAGGPGRDPRLGNLVAIAAGCAAALYLVLGRHLRARLGAWSYTTIVYGAAFVTLLAVAGATHVPVAHQPPRELLIFLALALGPMLLGHTGMNWALEHLPAYLVNLTALGEPVGATLLGMLLPGIHEVPPWTTLAGGVVVLAGVVVTAWTREPVVASIIETS